MFVTFVCNYLIYINNSVLLCCANGCLFDRAENVNMTSETICDIESLRCKMMNADHDGLRYNGADDALIYFNVQTRIVRSILLRDDKAFITTTFEECERKCVQPITLSKAGDLIDAWQRSATRLAAH